MTRKDISKTEKYFIIKMEDSLVILFFIVLLLLTFFGNKDRDSKNKEIEMQMNEYGGQPGDAVTYTLKSVNSSFVIIDNSGFLIMDEKNGTYNVMFIIGKNYSIYCGEYGNRINMIPDDKPNDYFIANAKVSMVVDCVRESCIYKKFNSMEICK